MNEFGNFLYSLRKEKGLTQAELANYLNVTNRAVSKWETGESMPETSLLLPLSKILNITVDELLAGKREEKVTDNEENNSESKPFSNNNQKQINDWENFEKHIFTKGKDETLLEKISGAVCSSVFLLGLTAFFFIGILLNVWTPYWVIIPVSALSCGIIGIIFNLFNKNKKEEKLKKGENIYLGSVCGLVMLLCIITYLLLGALLNLWHPYWIILILGAVFCGIAGAFGEVLKYKSNKKRLENK